MSLLGGKCFLADYHKGNQMSEVFKTQPAEQTTTIIPGGVKPETGAEPTEKLTEKKIENLDIWEGENKRKLLIDLMDVRETSHEFNIKMDIGKIDKFIKSEMETRQWEKTVENYKKILAEIEGKIQTTNLERFERIKRLAGYSSVMERQIKLNEEKKKWLIG